MILFLNTFITSNSLSLMDRGLYGPNASRYDVLRYSLASMSVIPWSSVVLYIELDKDYVSKTDELQQYINELFPNADLTFKRCSRQPEWRIAVEKLMAMPDELVWYSGNDDNIFVDYEIDFLKDMEARLLDLNSRYEYASLYYSHWPEMLQYLNPDTCNFYHRDHPPMASNIIERGADYFVNSWSNCDSLQVVNKRLLKYWWLDHDYGDANMPRTDFDTFVTSPPDIACIFPRRELCRHYDGFSHVGIDINKCPPLIIPPGFFEKDIKILFGSTQRREGWWNVNPFATNYSTVDPKGADAKCMVEDLPLFWKDRISQVEYAAEFDPVELVRARNTMLLRFASGKFAAPTAELSKEISIALRSISGEAPLPADDAYQVSNTVDYSTVLRRSNRERSPYISFIICEKDSGKFEKETIQSFVDSTADKATFETIMVSVCDWAKADTMKLADIAIHSRQFSLWARNTFNYWKGFNEAAKEARSKYLIFCDSTVTFPPGFISEFIPELEKLECTPGHMGLAPIASVEGKEMLWTLNENPSLILAEREAFLAFGGFPEGRGPSAEEDALQLLL